jgi:hypothetical protein
MARHARLDAALRRLASAVDQLEAASGRHARAGAEKADLEAVLAVMRDDRGQLALELDGALSRARALEQASDEVARRLGEAGGVLRGLLAAARDGSG